MEPIQVGQTWRTRGGAEVVVESIENSAEMYPVNCSDEETRLLTGRVWKNLGDDGRDFVELIAGPGSLPPAVPIDEPAKGHIHAALMAEFAQDAAEHKRPWELWESKNPKNLTWMNITQPPSWREGLEYRRKPRTIRIGAFDVPEPLRVAPALNTTYFFVDLVWGPKNFGSSMWRGETGDVWRLNHGVAHLTPDAARMHAEALLSFTVVQS